MKFWFQYCINWGGQTPKTKLRNIECMPCDVHDLYPFTKGFTSRLNCCKPKPTSGHHHRNHHHRHHDNHHTHHCHDFCVMPLRVSLKCAKSRNQLPFHTMIGSPRLRVPFFLRSIEWYQTDLTDQTYQLAFTKWTLNAEPNPILICFKPV